MNNDNCIFCKIVEGSLPSYKVWEDDQHLAFLSIFPNTEGVTVVTTKTHHPSYVFDLPEGVRGELVSAAKNVADLITSKLPDVERCAMVFEGYGVDHVHAKLFPMHGTRSGSWKDKKSSPEKYFEIYEGYISTHDGKMEDSEKLQETLKKLTN